MACELPERALSRGVTETSEPLESVRRAAGMKGKLSRETERWWGARSVVSLVAVFSLARPPRPEVPLEA